MSRGRKGVTSAAEQNWHPVKHLFSNGTVANADWGRHMAYVSGFAKWGSTLLILGLGCTVPLKSGCRVT
jgi:hypothetical protein